jgi:hypothetical protein
MGFLKLGVMAEDSKVAVDQDGDYGRNQGENE